MATKIHSKEKSTNALVLLVVVVVVVTCMCFKSHHLTGDFVTTVYSLDGLFGFGFGSDTKPHKRWKAKLLHFDDWNGVLLPQLTNMFSFIFFSVCFFRLSLTNVVWHIQFTNDGHNCWDFCTKTEYKYEQCLPGLIKNCAHVIAIDAPDSRTCCCPHSGRWVPPS